jgi:hypothetical protein
MSILREAIDRGFEDMHRRMDDQRELNTERHNQNIAKMTTMDTDLKSVKAEVSVVASTVSGHTEALKTISGLGPPVTVANVTFFIMATGALLGVLLWILKATGVLK